VKLVKNIIRPKAKRTRYRKDFSNKFEIGFFILILLVSNKNQNTITMSSAF
jgi:hypothetical protein